MGPGNLPGTRCKCSDAAFETGRAHPTSRTRGHVQGSVRYRWHRGDVPSQWFRHGVWSRCAGHASCGTNELTACSVLGTLSWRHVPRTGKSASGQGGVFSRMRMCPGHCSARYVLLGRDGIQWAFTELLLRLPCGRWCARRSPRRPRRPDRRSQSQLASRPNATAACFRAKCCTPRRHRRSATRATRPPIRPGTSSR